MSRASRCYAATNDGLARIAASKTAAINAERNVCWAQIDGTRETGFVASIVPIAKAVDVLRARLRMDWQITQFDKNLSAMDEATITETFVRFQDAEAWLYDQICEMQPDAWVGEQPEPFLFTHTTKGVVMMETRTGRIHCTCNEFAAIMREERFRACSGGRPLAWLMTGGLCRCIECRREQLVAQLATAQKREVPVMETIGANGATGRRRYEVPVKVGGRWW